MPNRPILPPNVQRWLNVALPDETPLPKAISQTQSGEMDIRGNWLAFTAKTHYRVQPFTFTWRARFNVLPGVWLTAEDGHDSTQGWGGAKLWNFIPMGGRRTPEVLAMQLVRSLAELPWYPQLIPALPDLNWADTGETAFRVTANSGGQTAAIDFTLNDANDIIRASARRHYDVPDGFVEADWGYEFSDHRDFDGLRLPAAAVATYNKAEGPWEYWRGHLTGVTVER